MWSGIPQFGSYFVFFASGLYDFGTAPQYGSIKLNLKSLIPPSIIPALVFSLKSVPPVLLGHTCHINFGEMLGIFDGDRGSYNPYTVSKGRLVLLPFEKCSRI